MDRVFTLVFHFPLQYNPTWMRGKFGLKLQNSPKLPHTHCRFYCNANGRLFGDQAIVQPDKEFP